MTSEYKEIHDHEIVIVKKDEVIIKDAVWKRCRTSIHILLKLMHQMLKKVLYAHYMLKEIHEQPAVMRRIIQEYQRCRR